MKIISLLYHDVIPPGNADSSGFPGADASVYKLDVSEFRRHLNAIHSVTPQCFSIRDALDGRRGGLLLTFDDGGVSAHQYIADLLEEVGWRGHFFITTDWIGKHGFLDAAQIRDLHRRGHDIGSHSRSHPERMSYCSRGKLMREWSESVAALTEILGERIAIASVPGGYYGKHVAEAAAASGIRVLFTSEPETSSCSVNGCRVLGRYTIRQGVRASTAAAIACGKRLPRYRQYAYWNLKKAMKLTAGTHWLHARRRILATRAVVRSKK